MKIYILTDGDYSDYHIIGAFTDNEAAKRASEKLGGNIEEYEANEIGRDNRYLYWIRSNNDDSWDGNIMHYNNGKLNEVRKVGLKRDLYLVYVLAEDMEHAIKIASDLIAQYKALHND